MQQVKRDEGWAWVVLVAGFLTYVLVFGIIASNGVVYSGLLEHFGDTYSNTAWVTFITQGIMNIFSLVAGYLGRRISYRFMIIVGGICAGVGLVSSFLSPALGYLYVTYGFILGMGLGYTVSPVVVMVGLYFERHRALANGLCFSGSSLGAVLIPPLYQWLMEEFGHRGSFLIMAGVALNICVCGALCRPPPPIEPVLDVKEKVKLMDCDDLVELGKKNELVEKNENGHFITSDKQMFGSRDKTIDKRPPFWERGDFQFLLNGIFFLIAFGWGFIMLSYASVVLMIPDFATNELMCASKADAAFLISVIAIGDLIGRIGFGWIVDKKMFKNKHGCTATFCFGGLVLMLTPEANSFASLVICCVLFGMSIGSAMTLQPILLIEYLGLKGFQHTFGYLGLFAGFTIISLSPAVGILRDATGSYASSMRLPGGFLMMIGFLWLTEPLILRCQKHDNSKSHSLHNNEC